MRRAGWRPREQGKQEGQGQRREPRGDHRTSEPLNALSVSPLTQTGCTAALFLTHPIPVTGTQHVRPPACEAPSPTSELISTFSPSCVFSLLIESW